MNLLQTLRSLFRSRPRLIVITGSTASGKTSFSLELAELLRQKNIQAEIISADSRQIYQGMTIFSGAVIPDGMQNVPHHLVGTEDPIESRSVDWFRSTATRLIDEIHARGHVPIVVGGTAFWVQSILLDDDFPAVGPNDVLRAQLEQCTVEQLQHQMQQLDPIRYNTMDNQNPRRLIRSIEIATALGCVPLNIMRPQNKYTISLVYFDIDNQKLREKITRSVEQRYDQGLIAEARTIYDTVGEHRFVELGLAYKYLPQFWAGAITESELRSRTVQEEYRYAKRQKTFCNKMLRLVRVHLFRISSSDDRQTVLRRLGAEYQSG